MEVSIEKGTEMNVVEERLRYEQKTLSRSIDQQLAGLAARSTVAMVLAGGRGTRLKQLTDWRAKPAVSFGGKFRIIDFALSNCINSGIRRIDICTQYKAHSLIRHIQRGWSFLDGARFDEWVELLPAQQRVTNDWYMGTADAVYQNLDILRRQDPQLVLVLAGDHIYKMDYRRMIEDHLMRSARITVACIEVPVEEATGFGVMSIDSQDRITAFHEKPAAPNPCPGRPDRALASMGIYIFDAAYLYEQLVLDAELQGSTHDFGRDVIPRLVDQGVEIYVHHFSESCINMAHGEPYWRDVGTVDAYWEANIDLTKVIPELNLYDNSWPTWTHQEQLPPAKFVFDDDHRRGMAVDSVVSGGCIVSGSTVRRSLLSSNVRVHGYCHVEDSVMLPNVEIGEHAVVKHAVIDKHCKLPPGFRVGVDVEEDRRRFHVTDKGIVLVTPDMLGQHIHHLR
jgi:glucose-1-phosphate adenylyltransferase